MAKWQVSSPTPPFLHAAAAHHHAPPNMPKRRCQEAAPPRTRAIPARRPTPTQPIRSRFYKSGAHGSGLNESAVVGACVSALSDRCDTLTVCRLCAAMGGCGPGQDFGNFDSKFAGAHSAPKIPRFCGLRRNLRSRLPFRHHITSPMRLASLTRHSPKPALSCSHHSNMTTLNTGSHGSWVIVLRLGSLTL